jgi:hypothetical protein
MTGPGWKLFVLLLVGAAVVGYVVLRRAVGS